MKRKTIAVLTSGGDAPGMNAAVRAVVRSALNKDMRVIGVRRGYNGLINGDVFEMNLRSVSDIIHRGGTVLYTARSPQFQTPEGIKKAVDTCELLGIDSVVVVGGDGSFHGAYELSRTGMQCIGIPGTIDNDIGCTDYTIGFDTAMNTAMEMVDKIRDTAQSHERCSIVEVMGRHCGDLALHTGIAVGAMAILVPEMPFDIKGDIIKKMKLSQIMGKKHYIIIVAEGVGNVNELAKRIHSLTGFETRSTVLGHVQRGGSPTLRDRLIASKMGCVAVDIISDSDESRVIALKDNEVVSFEIQEALAMTRSFDVDLYKTALEISV